jgi:hypothetical protein|tara:strand:+ start:9761 stop:10084 length:324 start_codon:yes stop_codon:yes gene_type:complete
MAIKLDTNTKHIRDTLIHDNGESIVAQTTQDVTDIIEQNKKEYNSTTTSWGSGDVFDNKIASIPLTVIDELNKQQIMRGFHVLDMPKFKNWLNDPDNRFFRTKQGRI